MKDDLEVKIKKVQEEPVTFSQVMAGPSSGLARIPTDVVVGDTICSPIAERKRMILNPDQEVVNKIIGRIFKCGGLCPCQPKDSPIDTRCPCGDFTGNGVCHCKLFIPAE